MRTVLTIKVMRSLRHSLKLLPLLAFSALAAGCGDAGEATPDGGLILVREDPTDNPIAGLSDEEMARFDVGDVLFEREFQPRDGLGPVFIRAACGRCHAGDSRGPGIVERAIFVEPDGFTPREDQSAFRAGPVLRPQFVAPATRGVTFPMDAPMDGLLRSVRVGPAVFGRGWIEAVTDESIVAGAEAQAREGVVHGRVSRLGDGRIGRFGVKARIATLLDFAADAFRGDMGLTSPIFPTEVANADDLTDDDRPGVDLTMETVEDVAFYTEALAIPRREGLTDQGRQLFATAGCATCHTPSLPTRANTVIRQMANTRAEIYSDLLLHDMGTALADGAREGMAGPRDYRTAPLMGIRHFRTLMHDGRVRTVEDAVRVHRGEGSEANFSVEAVERMSAADRQTLFDFVRRL